MRKIIIALFICLSLLAAGEVWLHKNLFKYASYSNSESIDRQLQELHASNDWNLLFVGDSETRWGIDPREIDRAFSKQGVMVKSFNHGFDGFGASWWARLLPHILKQPALENVKVVVIGIQMTTSHRVMEATGEDCGALQRPVLTSPFAKDFGIDALCRKPTWDSELGKHLFGNLWLVRYSSTLHALLLPSFMNGNSEIKLNSRKDGEPFRGFEPHRSISQDRDAYDGEFARWKAQFQPDRDFVPLSPGEWEALTASSGFFDQLHKIVEATGRQLVLFALPSNPKVIDTFHRRDDYHRNSQLLSQWAASRGVTFIDLGIQEPADPEFFFSDMRHLSGTGAKLYSKLLGEELAKKVGTGILPKSLPSNQDPDVTTRSP
jgi:hypothetical protein